MFCDVKNEYMNEYLHGKLHHPDGLVSRSGSVPASGSRGSNPRVSHFLLGATSYPYQLAATGACGVEELVESPTPTLTSEGECCPPTRDETRHIPRALHSSPYDVSVRVHGQSGDKITEHVTTS